MVIVMKHHECTVVKHQKPNMPGFKICIYECHRQKMATSGSSSYEGMKELLFSILNGHYQI